MSTIYMYHAVGIGEDVQGSDLHYAVSGATLGRHLKIIAQSSPVAHQLQKHSRIVEHSVTFDDGHLSNFTRAFPVLMEAGHCAEFYVNSSQVGRPHFASWDQLKQMSDAGMSIQSHGHRHVYMSDLTDVEIQNELKESKHIIEDKLSCEVSVFAPPGGRYDARVTAIAKSIGYKAMATSKPGICPKSSRFILPRFAVLSGTTDVRINNWMNHVSMETVQQVAKYYGTGATKRLMGNRRYDAFRENLLKFKS